MNINEAELMVHAPTKVPVENFRRIHIFVYNDPNETMSKRYTIEMPRIIVKNRFNAYV